MAGKSTLLSEFESSIGVPIDKLSQAEAVDALRRIFARMQEWVDADEEMMRRRRNPEHVPFRKQA